MRFDYSCYYIFHPTRWNICTNRHFSSSSSSCTVFSAVLARIPCGVFGATRLLNETYELKLKCQRFSSYFLFVTRGTCVHGVSIFVFFCDLNTLDILVLCFFLKRRVIGDIFQCQPYLVSKKPSSVEVNDFCFSTQLSKKEQFLFLTCSQSSLLDH